MHLARRSFLHLVSLAGAASVIPRSARAQGYPTKPIRIVVPFAAGGPTDVVARLIGSKVGESLGQQVIIENVLGASGNIGTRNVARAAPDGYTLLVTASGFVVNPSLYASNPYDPIKDFAPITVAASAPNVLIVHPSVPAKTVKELVEFVRANPGKHNFASAGVGQTGHLAGELLKTSYKLDLAHVPFAGGAPIMNSMMGGHTLIAFLSLPSAAAFIRDNRVRGLAVTARKRSTVVPDVPTMAESGFPELETEFFQGILAPAGTPKEIIERWHAEVVKAAKQPDVQKKLAAMSFEAQPNTPEQFAAMIKAEVAKWAAVIRDAKLPQVQ
ncbi:MAG: tripartite tricarboxylate transporter substrate binding protein [Hyphomicrobiales bacterium]|nr:tripartite tricarboxylate transporter substrate binding protein [Hyphomicrobiales bacterium]